MVRAAAETIIKGVKPYTEYKDSGVEWLGKIPAHWELKRLRFLCCLNPGKSEIVGISKNLEVSFLPMERVGEDGFVSLEETREIRDVWDGYTYFRDGDILVAKITPCFENGKGTLCAGLTNGIGFGTTEFHVLRPHNNINSHFLFYLTISHLFRKIGKAMMIGAAGQKRVPENFIKNLRIGFPPTKEQKSIVSFLDCETSKINEMIRKKEGLISLLEEKRTALISHAVTKGLNPNTPIKDSGVEWLGKIPAHWQIIPLKRRVKRIQTGSTPPTAEQKYYDNEDVSWYGPGSFSTEIILKNPVKFISRIAFKDGVARLFEAGTTMIVTIGATIGKVGFLEEAASSNQQITAVTFKSQIILPMYGAYQMKRLENVLRRIAPTTTLPILDQQKIEDLPFIHPPYEEQEKIVKYINEETAKIDTLIQKNREVIDKLQEYRIALILAAVTGKIDVRKEVDNVKSA